MVWTILARAGRAGALIGALAAVALPAGAASADPNVLADQIAAAAAGAVVPEGSTLVPSRRQLLQSLGLSDLGLPGSAPGEGAGPGAVVSDLCIPAVGTPAIAPSGTSGAVGPVKGVIITATGFLVFDKADPGDCDNATFLSLKDATLFSGATATEVFERPEVVFDPHASKFVIGALSHDSADNKSYLYTAISTDAAATAWTVTRGEEGNYTSPAFNIIPDTIHVGFAKDFWYFTFNHRVVGFANNPGTVLRHLRKSDSQHFTIRPAFSNVFDVVPPLVLDDSTGVIFLAATAGSGTTIRRFSLAATFGSLPAEIAPIAVPAYTAPPAVTQQNGQKLDAGTGIFQGPSIQIGNALWNVHTVNVGGHARFRLYKFSTTGTTPLLTFTPTITGVEDLFNATMATSSDTAGARAFVSASGTIGSLAAGQFFFSFTGPNDSMQGWSYDVIPQNSTEFVTTDGATQCNTAGSCAWVASSATAMDPADTTIAWVFNQLGSGSKQTDWLAIGAPVGGAGASFPPLAPIASGATNITATRFIANWSAQPPAFGYQLSVATDAAFTSHVPGFQVRDVGNATSFPVTGLSPSTTYFYRVWAVAAATSLPSNTIPVTTAAAPPPTPDNPACTLAATPDTLAAGGGSAALAWTSANATSGSIAGIGDLSPVAGGSVTVNATVTTVYTALFTGPGGVVECVAALTVRTPVGSWDPWTLLGLGGLAAAGLARRRKVTVR